MKLIDLLDPVKADILRRAIIETSCPSCALCGAKILEHPDLLGQNMLNKSFVHQECGEDLHYEIVGEMIERGRATFPIVIDLRT